MRYAGVSPPREPLFSVCRPAVLDHHHRLLPQTTEVRQVCASLNRRGLGQPEYGAVVEGWTDDTVRWQEELGFDVLVHGEFERNDMVTLDLLRAATPLKRMATSEEVAATIVFLALKGAAYITGAVVPVNGGIRMD